MSEHTKAEWIRQNPGKIITSGSPVINKKVKQTHGKIPKPGDMLAGLIRAIGFKEDATCGCHAFRKQMDSWGWWGCWRQRQEIYERLAVKAAERGILIDQAAFWPLFRQAIRRFANRRSR